MALLPTTKQQAAKGLPTKQLQAAKGLPTKQLQAAREIRASRQPARDGSDGGRRWTSEAPLLSDQGGTFKPRFRASVKVSS